MKQNQFSPHLVSVMTRYSEDLTPRPMATRHESHRHAVREMATRVDSDNECGMPSQEYRGRTDRVGDAVCHVRESRIADALALAAASYSYSRAYDLSFFSALSGAISLFWSRLRGGGMVNEQRQKCKSA